MNSAANFGLLWPFWDFSLLVLVFNLCLSFHSPWAPPPPPPRCSCVRFVPLKFIELVPTAEMQKIRETVLLLLGIVPWISKRRGFVGVCVVVCPYIYNTLSSKNPHFGSRVGPFRWATQRQRAV